MKNILNSKPWLKRIETYSKEGVILKRFDMFYGRSHDSYVQVDEEDDFFVLEGNDCGFCEIDWPGGSMLICWEEYEMMIKFDSAVGSETFKNFLLSLLD